MQMRPLESMVFPFGKHKGVPITSVPKKYLRWAVENMDALTLGQREEIEELLAEYDRRYSKAKNGKETREVPIETLEELMDALHFYSEPAVYQPTRSGDTAPIWVDTDATYLDGEDMPGATARAVLAKLRAEGEQR